MTKIVRASRAHVGAMAKLMASSALLRRYRVSARGAKASLTEALRERDLLFAAVDEGVPERVAEELRKLGHNVQVRRLGNAHGLTVEYDKQGRPERFRGAADPRGEGQAIGR